MTPDRVIRSGCGHATCPVGPALLVIAKAPVAGRVKTRLCPPCTPEQAAALARAALHGHPRRRGRCDAAPAAASSCSTATPGPWLPAGFEVIAAARRRPRRAAGRRLRGRRRARLPRRHGHAAGHAGPARRRACDAVAEGDSAFGAALDGGYWGIGLRTPDAGGLRRRADEHASAPAPSSAPAWRALGLHAGDPARRCATSTRSRTRSRVAAEAPRDALRRRAGRGRRRRSTRSRHDSSLDEPRRSTARRRAPLPADLLYGRLLASAAQHLTAPGRRPSAGIRLRRRAARAAPARPLARARRRRRRGDPRRRRSAGARPRLRAGPPSRRAARAGKRGLGVDLSPVAVAARPRARRGRRSTARCGRRSRRRHLADDPAAGRQHRHRRRAGRCCCKRAGELLAPRRRDRRRDRPAGRAHAARAGPARGARTWCRSGSAGRGSAPMSGRRSPSGRGSRVDGQPGAGGPHVRNAQTLLGRDPVPLNARPAPPGPFRPGLLALAAARPVADRRRSARSCWCWSRSSRLTGFLSHAAYMPDLPGNAIVPADRDLPAHCFDWPTVAELAVRAQPGPAHERRPGRDPVPAGEAVVGDPAAVRVAAGRRARRRRSSGCRSRCWSPARCSSSPRASMNAQYWYPFKFNFVVAHYYGAIVFVASLVLHVIVKMPVILRAYRERGVLKPLRDDLAHTRPEPATRRPRHAEPGRADDLAPRPVRLRRRGRAAAAGRERRPVDRRAAAQARVPRAAPRDVAGDFPVNKTAPRPRASRRR